MLQVFLGSNTLENQCYSSLPLSYKTWSRRPSRSEFCGFLKKALTSREEPDISLSIVNSKARLHLLILARYARNISPKHGSALNTRNDFIRSILNVTSRKRGNRFRSRCEGWRWCSWWRESCWCTKVSFLEYVYHAINEYQLRLDVQQIIAQTVSERQSTSQWKSTGECGAETPEERETNGSSVIRHFEGGDEDVME